MNIFFTVNISFLILFAVTIHPQVPFNSTPDWVSQDIYNYSTGAAFTDINQDGWIDFVIANGNDMARQKVTVYLMTEQETQC